MTRARKRPIGLAPFNTAECRAKIKASQLIHRLQAHIFDGLELSMSQIKAIDILLSDEAYRRVSSWLAERSLTAEPEQLELKGFDGTQPAYRLASPVRA